MNQTKTLTSEEQSAGTATESPLHPSWEASKRKKKLSEAVTFQGRRTVFADSDGDL